MKTYRDWLWAIDDWIEKNKGSIVQDLVQLISVESVAVETPDAPYPLGEGCARVLDMALDMAKHYGLETENDDYYCGSAILPGKTAHELAMVGHLDVVPAGRGWDFEPFKATIRDGQIIGRGAVDNKGAVVSAMAALRCLRELGIYPRHTIRLLMGCHEESGMTDMPHFLETHADRLPDLFLVCDCSFPIHYGEKGIMRFLLEKDISDGNLLALEGGVSANSIPEAAYAVISGVEPKEAELALLGFDIEKVEPCQAGVRISCVGVSGHAASPETGTENAITKLAHALNAAGLLTGSAQTAIAFLDQALSDYYGSGLGLDYEDEQSGKNTAVGGIVRFENGVLSQTLNVRCAITADQTKMLENIQGICDDSNVRLRVLSVEAPLYIPLDSMNGLPRKLTALANELLEMGELEPAILPGGTHTRLLPNAIGYGPNLGPELEFRKKRFGAPHGANEAAILEDIFKAVRVYTATWIWLDEEMSSSN